MATEAMNINTKDTAIRWKGRHPSSIDSKALQSQNLEDGSTGKE